MTTNLESRLIAAARALTISHHVGTERTTLAEAVALGHGKHTAEWRAFLKALDAMRAAETPCGSCGGGGHHAKEDGEDCPACDGFGWVLEGAKC